MTTSGVCLRWARRGSMLSSLQWCFRPCASLLLQRLLNLTGKVQVSQGSVTWLVNMGLSVCQASLEKGTCSLLSYVVHNPTKFRPLNISIYCEQYRSVRDEVHSVVNLTFRSIVTCLCHDCFAKKDFKIYADNIIMIIEDIYCAASQLK